jgi:excisionase family DNA binding protein
MTTPSDELTNDRPPEVSADPPPTELLSVADAARWLGVSRSSLYRALSAHRIPVSPVNLGGHVRLPRRQLERWLEGGEDPASAGPQLPPPVPAPRRTQRAAATYDDVFRALAPLRERRSPPTTSAASRSTSSWACA